MEHAQWRDACRSFTVLHRPAVRSSPATKIWRRAGRRSLRCSLVGMCTTTMVSCNTIFELALPRAMVNGCHPGGQLCIKSSSRHRRQYIAAPKPIHLKAMRLLCLTRGSVRERSTTVCCTFKTSRLTFCCSSRLALAASRDGASATTVDDHRQGKGATLSPMHPESSRSNACKDYIANTSFHSMPRSDLTCSQSR
jgi:hypothetical protein